ncbi:MAG: YifB family Mg chelatase-like AAA ATPase [Candidatus Spechtbacterales bacterium]
MAMPSLVYSAARQGMTTQTVSVEADVSVGLHSFRIVGLPDKAVDEAKERVSSALKNSACKPPRTFSKRVIINLAPADVRKEGGWYDLPMALGFLADSDQLRADLSSTLCAGELALNGELRPITGALLLALHAREAGFSSVIIPYANRYEAALVRGVAVFAPRTMRELLDHLEGRHKLIPTRPKPAQGATAKPKVDFADIQGQEHAKYALEIAAAGGHNVLMQGPPGSGKTLLARAAAGILPPLSYTEALEATKIASVCGDLTARSPLVSTRPFRSPHHASSEAALLGGGNGLKPGEVTRAHRGVLFLDEFPEFHRDVLESLRQPLEEGTITVARAAGSVQYPAQSILIAAANPCPCGYFGDETRECSCSPTSIVKYQRKLSGPIADRIDLHVTVPRQPYAKISGTTRGESSSRVQARVTVARKRQEERFARSGIVANSEMSLPQIKRYCAIDEKTSALLGMAVEKYRLSARAYHSSLKVARTIADLAGDEVITWKHIASALQFARRERELS